eukprot:COSAG02_NODE_63801_length_262_cov_0.638037_1_plen_30_part_10
MIALLSLSALQQPLEGPTLAEPVPAVTISE